LASGDQRWLAAAGNALLESHMRRRDNNYSSDSMPTSSSATSLTTTIAGAATRATQIDAVLSAIGDAYVFSGALEFVVSYARLHAAWRERKFAAFSRRTIELLNDGAAPRRYWLTLMLDCVPLLERNAIVFQLVCKLICYRDGCLFCCLCENR
jgi:hypothetical protein